MPKQQKTFNELVCGALFTEFLFIVLASSGSEVEFLNQLNEYSRVFNELNEKITASLAKEDEEFWQDDDHYP